MVVEVLCDVKRDRKERALLSGITKHRLPVIQYELWVDYSHFLEIKKEKDSD